MPVVARADRLHVLAEPQNDRALLRIDAVDAAGEPHAGDEEQHAGEAPPEVRRSRTAAAAAAAAPKKSGETALQIAQHVVQIVLRLRAIPRIALLAARFVPSHSCA